MSLFGGADRNASKRKQERSNYKRAKDEWRDFEERREESYDKEKELFEKGLQNQEDNLRFQEKGIIQNYETAVERQNYEYEVSKRAYDKSVEVKDTQLEYNEMASRTAMIEQNAKLHDDMIGVLYEQDDMYLAYASATSGLKVDKHNELVQADFEEAKNQNQFTSELSKYELDRRAKRSQGQLEAQKVVLDGMKAAGQIRARAGAGRSSSKASLAVMAESGAMRSAIANGLMYAEDGINLGIAQLKDMLILDQTMVAAARDMAETVYDSKTTQLDSQLSLDKRKFHHTNKSIRNRDKVVKQKILNAQLQADLNAEAAVMLEPNRLPDIVDPRKLYAEYDNPETEDYIEMMIRPLVQEFPDYVESPEPDYERDFHYSLGRENVAASNFGDSLKIGGMVAGAASGVGTLLQGGLFGGATAGSVLSQTGFLAKGAEMFGTWGTGLTGLSSSFYPQQQYVGR